MTLAATVLTAKMATNEKINYIFQAGNFDLKILKFGLVDNTLLQCSTVKNYGKFVKEVFKSSCIYLTSCRVQFWVVFCFTFKFDM